MHARGKIRRAVAHLVTGLQTTADRVFASRVYPIDSGLLPSLSVYATAERVARATINDPPLYQRVVEIVIEGHVEIEEELDDRLDQIALEVETAMSNPIVVDGQIVAAQLTGTTLEFSADGAVQIGMVSLSYLASYGTLENTPDQLSNS